jgi:hypothetical protein
MPLDLCRLIRAFVAFLTFIFSSHLAFAASPISKEEIGAAAIWFEGLQWPDVRGKPYVEITFGTSRIGSKVEDGPKIRGFLLAEDDQSLTVLSDGTIVQPRFFRVGWPFVIQRIPKTLPDTNADSKVTRRTIELTEVVKELLTELRRPKDEDEKRISFFGRKTSDRTAVFVLARCCARQGRADLAEQLDAEQMTPGAGPWGPSREENVSFRAGIEMEIAHALMWKTVVDFGDAGVSRPELLAQFERIVRDFPASEHRERAAGLAEMLRTMVAEDEAHTRTAKPIEGMSVNEKVHELIFRLRDQNGHQWSQPGSCDIFDDWGGTTDGKSPAHELVKLGHAAVPALIDALGDKRLSRSVGCHRDFYFSHFVLAVGDCAEAILSRIAGRSFRVAHNTSAAMQKDGQLEATREAVEQWWLGVQGKGEKEMLIEGVRSGENDSAVQAGRLTSLDPAAALDAIAAGLRSAKSNWVRTRLVAAICMLKSEEATEALHREMKTCASLHARVAAATELFRRGRSDTVPEMIGELSRWKASARAGWDDDKESAEPLIVFLGTCGDVSAMKALADRFASMPIDVKFKILDVATETDALHESVRSEKSPLPAEVESIGQDLAVAALEDRRAYYGMGGTRGDVSYRDPRVCDMAAYRLGQRWPQRYRFKWSPTRLERDPQIVQARNVWRETHGLEPLPLPEHPSHESAAQQPNVVASLKWTGGAPLADIQIAEGKPLTVDTLIEAIARLHRELPKGFAGFDFTAERAGDRRGFVLAVEWAPRPDSNPSGAWIAGGGWSYHIGISLGDESLYNSGGGGSLEHRAQPSGYETEKRALTKALAADANQSISISLSSRLTKD